jgi:3-hydroxyisobutyrate dehydrogenase
MKVGFIGLGNMGGGMSLNMRKAGFEMVVHDLNHEAAVRQIEAGCEWAGSPLDVAKASDIVFTSLPGPPEVEAVALGQDGLIAGMRPGTTWFDLSTNSPTVIRRLHAEFAAQGINMLDAPVSGGKIGADRGLLAIWVGGDEAEFNKHKPLLDSIGDAPKYIGPIGAGSVAKLVHNLSAYAIQAALAEAFTMGVKAGVDPLPLWEAIRYGAMGRRRAFDTLSGLMEAKWDPASFALKLAFKDVTLATQLAREVHVPMRISNLVREELEEAMGRGWGDRDSRIAMLLQEERAGLDIKIPIEEIDEVRNRG